MNEAPVLSIVITIVGGTDCVRRCLMALLPQLDSTMEVIVPYDHWSSGVSALVDEFPAVRFHRISDAGLNAPLRISARAHRLYDRRRAAGLTLARGDIVAMTEDTMVPAPDWCRQLVAVHEQPHAVIGGPIESGIDRPLERALYFCDFGRYGLPLAPGPAAFASDCNISYKRRALESTRHLWRESYHETTVHWHLQENGEALFLDPRPRVRQHRPPTSLRAALRERLEWGRIFAETRVGAVSTGRRILYAFATPLLPGLLLVRALCHMLRQAQGLTKVITALPFLVLLLCAWSVGELWGYLVGPPSLSPFAAPRDLELGRR